MYSFFNGPYILVALGDRLGSPNGKTGPEDGRYLDENNYIIRFSYTMKIKFYKFSENKKKI